MDSVILLYEDNHGLLALFNNYNAVIDFLIENDWLSDTTDVCTGEDETSYDWQSINKVLGIDWETKVRQMSKEKFNEFFNGCFYIEQKEVYRG